MNDERDSLVQGEEMTVQMGEKIFYFELITESN